MNIVMVDSGQLKGDADFPEIDINKYGWLQFVDLDADELEERCWRADIIISTHTPITAQIMQEAYKLKLIIAAGESTEHIDQEAAQARGLEVYNTPGLTGNTPEATQAICQQVVEKINTWLKQQTTG